MKLINTYLYSTKNLFIGELEKILPNTYITSTFYLYEHVDLIVSDIKRHI
jgi:hypothetical protein